ncbi:MAG TPA: transcription termination factor NusA [Persephonella sp.]|uniref:Transcription termination/antitermination protein NusA n=1 Tax=Persephonella marina (strain DSM 14350 / EX-H1) TaxID=123214 RepID=C0QTL7_PERMH|nr:MULTISPECIES: transcription termination factor NusA [Persephonella]ACO04570.1 transcription termination factor NusA [Persephonella marina EX-H1]HCB70352.1 transcription termination factor NusA [Persephonella sp.]
MAVKLKNVIEAVAKEKNVPEEIIEKALIDGITAAVKKEYGYKDNVQVIFDKEADELKVLLKKRVTPFVENPKRDISLEEAKKIDPKAEVGSYVFVPLNLEELGRIALNAAKEVITHKVARVEKNILFKEFKELEGKIVTGTVRRFEDGDIIVDLGRIEAVLPEEEQIKKEKYRVGDRIRALILKVIKDGSYPVYERGKVKRVIKPIDRDKPLVILSRTHPNFLRKLIEIEVPEIQEGEIEIKAIAREPGERAKVAVWTEDKNIDPVGVVVGLKGSRIQNVSAELSGEKIDVIEWDPDPAQFILRALSPSHPKKWRLLEDEKRIEVAVPKNELSLAIGKGGINAKLAHKLTGWHIDILSEEDFERIQQLPRKTAG